MDAVAELFDLVMRFSAHRRASRHDGIDLPAGVKAVLELPKPWSNCSIHRFYLDEQNVA